MNRRGFFGVLASVAATAALDPERLLWVRGQKLISIPAPVPVEIHPRYLTDLYIQEMLPRINAKIWAQWRADGALVQSRVKSGSQETSWGVTGASTPGGFADSAAVPGPLVFRYTFYVASTTVAAIQVQEMKIGSTQTF